MGLDWNPLGKSKPGHEAEFAETLRRILAADSDRSMDPPPRRPGFGGFLRDLVAGSPSKKEIERLLARPREIEITPYETLNAPRVGSDEAADKWAVAQYDNRADKAIGVAEFVEQWRGYYVLDLLAPCDGLPVYSNSGLSRSVERFSFRAQFFRYCERMLGDRLLDEAYRHHTAEQLADYGRRLRDCVIAFAEDHGVTAVFERRLLEDYREESPSSQAHIVMSAARWCLFWSDRGHGMEAYW